MRFPASLQQLSSIGWILILFALLSCKTQKQQSSSVQKETFELADSSVVAGTSEVEEIIEKHIEEWSDEEMDYRAEIIPEGDVELTLATTVGWSGYFDGDSLVVDESPTLSFKGKAKSIIISGKSKKQTKSSATDSSAYKHKIDTSQTEGSAVTATNLEKEENNTRTTRHGAILFVWIASLAALAGAVWAVLRHFKIL
ncbi:MAG: hypothetical protein ABJG41_01255 [Cyclobacteriaceae bacterium]